MRLKKIGDRVLIVEGIGEENAAEVEIELLESSGNDTIRINGRLFNFQDGKRRVPLGAFSNNVNEVKICSGGCWYVLEGVVRQDKKLKLDPDCVAQNLVKLILENADLKQKTQVLEKRVKELEDLCSGENFL